MPRSKKNEIMARLFPILKISGIAVIALFVLLIIGLFISPQPFYTQGFRNLTEIQKYAASVNELTPLESENAVKPDFTRYYKQFSPSIINTILEKLGGLFETLKLKNPPAFTPSFFKSILEDVNKIREQKGFKKENIVKVIATPQSKFVVIGDLQAAFHSLVRDCAKLKELGILGEDLKIIPPDCYIIFIGNVPSRSPFSMEIMGLVLRLMQQNPDRVLYTKGSHESDGYWEEHTLKTELKIRTASIMKDAAPLIAEVNKLFDSLPSIIYLAAPAADKNAFVRFSRVTRAKLPDKHFAQFLMTEHKDAVSILSWQGNPPAPVAGTQEINVKAIMRVEKKRETYQPSEGLRTLAPEMGITTWTLLSGPTLAVERGFKFYNDTFALIEAASQIEQWKITLFYQDRRKKDGYKTKPLFLTSGRETAEPAAPAPTSTKTPAAAPVNVPAIPVASAQSVQQAPVQVTTPTLGAVQQATPISSPAPAQSTSTPAPIPQQAAPSAQPPTPQPAQQQASSQISPASVPAPATVPASAPTPPTVIVQPVTPTPVSVATQPSTAPTQPTSPSTLPAVPPLAPSVQNPTSQVTAQ